jgi:hypothetical protein
VVLAPQEPGGSVVLPGIRFQKLGTATHHHESQEVPVLCIAVGDEDDVWVFEDVPHAFEA